MVLLGCDSREGVILSSSNALTGAEPSSIHNNLRGGEGRRGEERSAI
jgi:hypothetical protein